MTKQRIFLWCGYHGASMHSFIKFCWEHEYLLVCCPPHLRDFSFIDALPAGDLEYCGQWPSPPPDIPKRRKATTFTEKPVLGVFTSGTSKDSRRLVLYTRENILSCQRAIFDLYDLSKIKRVFSFPQPYHVFGLLLGHIAALCYNWEFISGNGSYSSEHHEAWLQTRGPELLTLLTPVHLRDLTKFVKGNEINPRESYSCIIGGARVTKDDWLQAKATLQIEQPSIGYGCTEASPGITHLPPGIEPDQDGDIGYPLKHGKLKIATKSFEYSGPSVAMASIENGVATMHDKIKVPDDLEKASDGRLTFATRTDALLNRGGEKFSLEEMESVIKEKLDINAICVSVEDKRLGQDLGILIEAPTRAAVEDVTSSLKKRFGRKFKESYVVEVTKLPTSDNSKYDRRAALDLWRRRQPD